MEKIEWNTSLEEFFKEYMFKGRIKHRMEEYGFSLNVLEYYPKTRDFVAAGEDEKHGLSAIIGKVIPENENEARLEMKQIYDPTCSNNLVLPHHFLFSGHMRKTDDNVIMEGKYGEIRTIPEYTFELKTVPRRLAYIGWMDMALRLALPKKE